MEYCASVRIAPRDREVGDAEGAAERGSYMVCNPTLLHQARKDHLSLPSGRDVFFDRFLGLKPQAQSRSPFGTKILERRSVRPEPAPYSDEPLHSRFRITH